MASHFVAFEAGGRKILRITRLASLFISLVCAAGLGRAAETPALRPAGQVGGSTIATALAGNVALAGAGYRLVAYDVSDPAVPREVGAVALDDLVRSITVDGARAFVAAGGSGLHIVDLADPSSPSVVGRWNSPGSAEAVAVVGTTAYLADGPFGVHVLDVSAPQNPTRIGGAFDDSMAFDVALSGTIAMVAAGGEGLLLADVSDPRAPRAMGSVDTPGHARAVAAFGSRAVVADQWEGLRVIDVSDPRAPVEIGALATRSWALDVAIDGTTALVATGSEGLTSVDLSAPTHPREAASLPIAGLASAATAVAAAGGRAAVAAGIGLVLVDVSAPSALRLAGAITPFARAVGVEVASPFVYVSGSPHMTVIDASSPGTAREVGVLGLPGEMPTSNYIARHGEVVYIGTLGGSLIAADVTDPSRPVETARVAFPLAGNVYATAVAGSLMAAAVETWVGIFDIADPHKPVIRSTLPMRAEGVAAIGRFAFVGEAGQGLTVIDFADPAAPSIVARYPDAAATAVVAVGNYIYVATCDRVEVVDVSVPKEPKLATVIPVTGCVTIMRRAGESVFLIDRDGIVEVDVSIPASPSIASRTPVPASRILGLAGDDALVAVAAATSGIFLFQRNEDGAKELARRAGDRTKPLEETPPPAVPPPRAPEERPEPQVVTPQGVAPTARQVIVTSTANDGAGTLRRAIASAVAADVITFDAATFPPQAPATIRLESPMECVPSGVSIDASNAGVVLDGTAIESDHANGIRLCNSNNVTVKGLQIINFTGSGFAIDAGSDNTIGGDPARGAGPVGEGNLSSGNDWAGITESSGAARNRIVGNLLGIAPVGMTLLHEQDFGIFAEGSENVIGGEPHERNVIGGNRVGVALAGSSSTRNTVSGNYIGTDATGTSIAHAGTASSSQMGISMVTAHENLVADNVIAAGTGIVIGDPGASFNRVIGNRIGIGSTGERVAGTLTGSLSGIGVNQPYNLVAGNVISGLGSVALHLGANDVFAIGNRIGTDPSGTTAIPNEGTGIRLAGTRAFVGGRSPSERNVVAGNAGAGIGLSGRLVTQNFVIGNSIGLNVYGEPLGNGSFGVEIATSRDNVIQRNAIAGNLAGIASSGEAANRIRRNSIFGNRDGAFQDASADPPPAPVIASVGVDFVSGSACSGCLVEVFSDTASEGRWFEGEDTADASGLFTMRLSAGRLEGPRVTATATGASGATSVFSRPAETPPRPERRRTLRR